MLKFVVPIFLFAVSSWAGQEVGNGGDVVSCQKSTENSLDGMYSLDFLMTQDSYGQTIETPSWENSLYRIRQVIYLKVPELLKSFDDFYVSILSEDHSLPMFWEKAPPPFQLITIDDQELPITVQLPKNCRNQNGELQLIQAVIREHTEFSGSSKIIFKYASPILETLKKDRPLQLSYLLVHEWLWSLSDKVDRNRRLTHFFHTEEFFKMSREEILQQLNSLGLIVSSIPVIVAADGSGQFVSLETAIEESPQASLFHLKEGRYFSTGKPISRPIRIMGIGDRNKTVILGTFTSPALRLATPPTGAQVEIRNVWFQKYAEKPEDGNHPAVEVLSGSPLITECRFGGDPENSLGWSLTGIEVFGSSEPRIINNYFSNLDRNGIILQNKSGGELRNNTYHLDQDSLGDILIMSYHSSVVLDEPPGTKIKNGDD